MRDPNVDFTFEIKKIFRSDPVDERNSMDLMVICWKRAGRPVLEKRRVWRTKTGEIRLRKLVGMNADDVIFIRDHFDEIKSLLS